LYSRALTGAVIPTRTESASKAARMIFIANSLLWKEVGKHPSAPRMLVRLRCAGRHTEEIGTGIRVFVRQTAATRIYAAARVTLAAFVTVGKLLPRAHRRSRGRTGCRLVRGRR
jgi:hypothetical protein